MNSKKQKDKYLLIVEDQMSDIKGLYNLASQLGYHVQLAFDGEQALNAVTTNSYDLIVLDWNMPFMDGEVFLNHLKKRPSANQQKIIIHTGENLSNDIFDSNEKYKILEIWQKPISAVSILQKLKELDERMAG